MVVQDLVKTLCFLFAITSALIAAPITRTSGENLSIFPQPKRRERASYPWEADYIGEHPRITKEYFRCKGSSMSPMKTLSVEGKPTTYLHDCRGGYSHGLPLIGEEEGVYPIMLHLLNYIQEKTGKRVVVTCGYRCPSHNAYADPSKFNETSKHMVGAEVDFYVQGLEYEPQKVVDLLLEYYGEESDRRYRNFVRYTKDKTNVATHPWYNKEVFIKLFLESEGRDFDNRHPYPYVCIQVRYDREREEPVIYEWKRAHYNYQRD